MLRFPLACVLMLLTLSAGAQPVRLGYVDTLRVEREAKRPQRDADRLRKEFSAREQEMRNLNSKVNAMQAEFDKLGPATPPAERDRRRRAFEALAQEFEQKNRSFLEDVDRRRSEERQRFILDVVAIVQKIAEAQKFDIVVDQAIYASRAVDITNQVVKALDSATK